jgi:hypothetical protein
VTINGSALQGVTAILFGPNAATGIACAADGTHCTATTPAGVGNVTVTAKAGTQSVIGSAAYAYIPSLASISPASGTPRGGTVVTITGAGFDTTAGATSFFFGSSAATGVSCTSSMQCTAVTPAGTRNTNVSVSVSVDGIAGSNSLTFRYQKR